MPLNYNAPLRDLHFLNTAVLGLDDEQADLQASLAEAMGRYAQAVLLPLNPVADREGCRWQGARGGQVSTPPGFVEAYRQWCALGWPGLCADDAHGGQALSALAFSQTQEIVAATCHAFQMLVSANYCASLCLKASASAELQAQWLPQLARGEALSTMCMTEPQAGSDLGLLRTRAEPVEQEAAAQAHNPGYRLHGTKVFISGGEHDLTEQVMHLVLARLPDAPAGSRGLSLFLVPRRLPDGRLNSVHCDGIEHKMGLHGNPTCTMRFEGALGWIIGAPHRGLAAMFPMMNQARLLSGLQAVGLSEAAFQAALAYAHERRQGRGPTGDAPRRLVDHADVQRMLLIQRALTEGGRALTHWTAHWIDRAAQGDAEAAPMLELLTPVIKGVLCENAQMAIHLAIQVHGGHGYIHETGLEQLARDARVITLYEGTTGIQAADLLLRKVMGPGGEARCTLLTREVTATLQDLSGHRDAAIDVAPIHVALGDTLARWQRTSAQWREAGDSPAAAQAAVPYLRLSGHLLLMLMWARMAGAASADPLRVDKATVALFYVEHLLPEVLHLAAQLDAPPWHAMPALALHRR